LFLGGHRGECGTADLSCHRDFGLVALDATEFFRLGAAAITFSTFFLGFFSSRRRLFMSLAMIVFLFDSLSLSDSVLNRRVILEGRRHCSAMRHDSGLQDNHPPDQR